jgi:hypothetical protein|tara:strand:+ start:43 stop:309 length:267 start_codon:yes stop_codon:yes gene_type:complete
MIMNLPPNASKTEITTDMVEQFVEIQLDNADTQFLYELAKDHLLQAYETLTYEEVKERIITLYDKELWLELLDNATFTYNSKNIPERY